MHTYVTDYVVFDLETTGISHKNDEVVEISAVKVQGGKVVDEFTTLVNPGIPISPQASAVNGITDEMVADSPRFDTVLKDFLDFAGDMVLVGHNIANFDLKFIYRDSRKYFNAIPNNDYIDTLPMACRYLPELSHHRLGDIAKHYGIDASGAHRALADCRMNQQIFERLGKDMRNPSAKVQELRVCPKCGNMLLPRNGMYGKFWGCSGYPECRYTEKA